MVLAFKALAVHVDSSSNFTQLKSASFREIIASQCIVYILTVVSSITRYVGGQLIQHYSHVTNSNGAL